MTFVLVDYKGGARLQGLRATCRTPSAWSPTSTRTWSSAPWCRWAPSCAAASTCWPRPAPRTSRTTSTCQASDPGLAPLPRLLIVIDEFASLARELPDFVTGLVNIAQRGRSLGIHLILATQRPSGVVSPEIRANTNLRIALRVTDASESTDVIDAPDAGAISKSTPGRAYVRLGPHVAGAVPGRPGRWPPARAPSAAERRRAVGDAARLGASWAGPRRRRARPAGQPTTPRSPTCRCSSRRSGRPPTTLGVPAAAQPVAAGAARPAAAGRPAGRRRRRRADRPARPVAVRAWRTCPAQQARRTAVDRPRHVRPPVRRRRARAAAARRRCARSPARWPGAQPRRPAPLRPRLRQRRAAAAGRAAALRRGRAAHPDPSGRRGCSAGSTAELAPPPGRARRPAASPTSTEQRSVGRRRTSGCPTSCCCSTAGRASSARLAELDGGALSDQVQTLLREGASVGIHLVITGDRQLVNAPDRRPHRGQDRPPAPGPRGLRPPRAPARASCPTTSPRAAGSAPSPRTELQFALLAPEPSAQAQAAVLRTIAAEATTRWESVPRMRASAPPQGSVTYGPDWSSVRMAAALGWPARRGRGS